MKLRHIFLALLFSSLSAQLFAQASNIEELTNAFQQLLQPADSISNSMSYTQQYIDLRSKLAALGPDAKSLFEQSIAQYQSQSGYEQLHALLFQEAGAAESGDSIPIAGSTDDAAATSSGKQSDADESMQWEVLDRRYKVLQTIALKPADLMERMNKDGYEITNVSSDIRKNQVTLILQKPQSNGTLIRVIFQSTGDTDQKFRITKGRYVMVHSDADGSASVKVSTASRRK